MKIYASRQNPNSLSDQERFLYYMNKFIGKDIWVKVESLRNGVYFFKFIRVVPNREDHVTVKFAQVHNTDTFAFCTDVDTYSPPIRDLSETILICEPLDVYTTEELREIYEDFD